MKNLRLAIIQSNLHWENISANLDMFSAKLGSIKQTDLIVLPETFTTGFSMNPKLAETMDGRGVKWMQKTAHEKNAVICGSLMITEGGKFYNRLIWAQPNGEILTYDKRHLFCISDEPKFFSAGNERLIVELNGWKVCPLICYDLRFPVWTRCFNHEGNGTPAYDILLYVANWPERRNHAWKTLLPARAIENQSFVVGVNRVGKDGNGMTHSGDSMAINAMGEILYGKEHEEDIFNVEFTYSELEKVRGQLPFKMEMILF